MASLGTVRFPVRFDRWYRWLSRSLLISPEASFIEVGPREVRVRMAWAFDARFPRGAVVSCARYPGRPLSRGVHGLAGRWLVNGSGEGVLVVDLSPRQRARVVGFPVRLEQLLVSVDDPGAVIRALGH
jgi:hypothetical protein